MALKIDTASTALGPVYLCYGAKDDQCHILSFKPGPDSPWATHKISCHQILGDPSSSIGVEPKRGEYQMFPVTGAALKLHCPENGLDRDMELQLRSEFSAQPLGISLKLGHYRCLFESRRPPIGAPIIGQKVTASVTVHSFYTHAPVENIDVVWMIGGQALTVPTTVDGVSDFTHTVTKEGKQTITVSLYNPYNDETITEEFSFTGYSSSPWEQARLIINGSDVKFGEPVVLTRGKNNDVTVEAPPEIAQQLVLGLADAGGLTLQATPDFDKPVDPVAGKFSWQLSSGASTSGLVTLVFHSLEVELPWELRCGVMSDDLADEVDTILVNGVESPPAQIQFFRNDPQTVTLTYKAGSPLQAFALQLEGTPLTGVQPANLSVTPAGQTTAHTWTVKSHTNSGTFQLELKGATWTPGIKLPVCKVMARYLSEEVSEVLVDGGAYPPDALFFRTKSKTITLAYKQYSPLTGYPLELKAIPVTGLQAGDLKVTAVTANPHTWKVEAINRSGTFRLELTGPEITRDLVLPVSKVLSANLADEVEVRLDGVRIPDTGAEFISGQVKTLTLNYLNGDLLKNIPLAADAVFVAGLVPGDVTSVPALRELTTPHEWKLTAKDKSGTFKLKLNSEQDQTLLHTPVIKIIVFEKVTFGFITLDDPEEMIDKYLVPQNTLLSPVRLKLENSKGAPLSGVKLTVSNPDISDQVRETNLRGQMVAMVAHADSEVGRTFKVQAVAALPDGDRFAELLVEIIPDSRP